MLWVSVFWLNRNIEVPVPIGVHGQWNLDRRTSVRGDPERTQGDQFTFFTEQPDLVELAVTALAQTGNVKLHLITRAAPTGSQDNLSGSIRRYFFTNCLKLNGLDRSAVVRGVIAAELGTDPDADQEYEQGRKGTDGDPGPGEVRYSPQAPAPAGNRATLRCGKLLRSGFALFSVPDQSRVTDRTGISRDYRGDVEWRRLDGSPDFTAAALKLTYDRPEPEDLGPQGRVDLKTGLEPLGFLGGELTEQVLDGALPHIGTHQAASI